MEKTSKEYAEKMAKDKYKDDGLPATYLLRYGLAEGYLKAVEETNVKGLLEACLKLMRHYEENGQILTFNIDIIRQEITKATK